MKPTIIIDNHIPFIKGVFDDVAEIHYLSATEIDNAALRATAADGLIVRTRTRCNETLLRDTAVHFIATATIGTDHIDADYCKCAGISWTNAPGCNASSVAQYVGSALALYAHEEGESLEGKTIGIVGHGHVGSEVEKIATALGMNILLCDPPKATINSDLYVRLEYLVANSDVITIHTPLTYNGDCPTYHLIGSNIFHRMPHRPLIINAARGGVVDESALITALKHRIVSHAVVDCWEGEPNVNSTLLEAALIATPHIAGYSADGKLNATQQVVAATAQFFGITTAPVVGLEPKHSVVAHPDTLPMQLLTSYRIYSDSAALKSDPTQFETLRNHYPTRRELKIIVSPEIV